jgi:hypothetical protein
VTARDWRDSVFGGLFIYFKLHKKNKKMKFKPACQMTVAKERWKRVCMNWWNSKETMFLQTAK